MSWVEDALFLIGLLMLGVGLAHRYGWDIALVVCGGILAALPIAAQFRRRHVPE